MTKPNENIDSCIQNKNLSPKNPAPLLPLLVTVDSIVCSLRMSLSVLDPFVTYVVSLETLCLHYVSLVYHIMGSPSKSRTIKKGGKNIISLDMSQMSNES